MYEDIKEPIKVVVLFRNGKAIPHSFEWRGREYPVETVNLEYKLQHGESHIFCFSISSIGNSYELSFDNINLVWKLERIWNG